MAEIYNPNLRLNLHADLVVQTCPGSLTFSTNIFPELISLAALTGPFYNIFHTYYLKS
jgi:hypothetical protein